MNNPLGRFEFRIWGNHLSPFRDRLAAIASASEPIESAETYILSRATDTANVKIRAELIDIKLMTEQVGRLERWRPVLKSAFPLDSRTIVEQVFPHLGVPVEQITQPSYTHGEFIRDLVRPHRELAIVPVIKVRRQFTSEKFTAEFAEVQIGRGATSSGQTPSSLIRNSACTGPCDNPSARTASAAHRSIFFRCASPERDGVT